MRPPLFNLPFSRRFPPGFCWVPPGSAGLPPDLAGFAPLRPPGFQPRLLADYNARPFSSHQFLPKLLQAHTLNCQLNAACQRVCRCLTKLRNQGPHNQLVQSVSVSLKRREGDSENPDRTCNSRHIPTWKQIVHHGARLCLLRQQIYSVCCFFCPAFLLT